MREGGIGVRWGWAAVTVKRGKSESCWGCPPAYAGAETVKPAGSVGLAGLGGVGQGSVAERGAKK